ncbi:hypothetical protein [Methanolobus sp.]|uniref:hypothetical protein n=1 Tax=Methanolobus sp. TaxID=1874737 RepID=UPI0025E2B515|nr:hypothetical protein [Methanolobus sp.]
MVKGTGKQIALAISKKDISSVKVASPDYEKISKVHNELQSLFMQKCNLLGIPVKRGRSHNLPTVTHAVNFLLCHSRFEMHDLEVYIDALVKEASGC